MLQQKLRKTSELHYFTFRVDFSLLIPAASISIASRPDLSTRPSFPKSMARTVLLSRRELKIFPGSLIRAPCGKVSLTEFFKMFPIHIIPLWDQTGTPMGLLGFFHFTSSTISTPMFIIMSRNRSNVPPRQSSYDVIIAAICSDWDTLSADLSFPDIIQRTKKANTPYFFSLFFLISDPASLTAGRRSIPQAFSTLPKYTTALHYLKSPILFPIIFSLC